MKSISCHWKALALWKILVQSSWKCRDRGLEKSSLRPSFWSGVNQHSSGLSCQLQFWPWIFNLGNAVTEYRKWRKEVFIIGSIWRINNCVANFCWDCSPYLGIFDILFGETSSFGIIQGMHPHQLTLWLLMDWADDQELFLCSDETSVLLFRKIHATELLRFISGRFT